MSRIDLDTIDLRKLPIVEVRWHDAASRDYWMTPKEVREHQPVEALTVGRRLPSPKSMVKVARDVNAVGHLSGIIAIPREWVTRIRRLA